jgi:Skp family chaperone for outer membrane proteins
MLIALVFTALLGAGPVLAQAPPPTPAPQTPAPQAPAGQTPPAPAPTTPQAPVPFPADARIGYVNFQYLVSQSQLGQAGRKQLQDLAAKNDAALAELTKKIQALEQELQSQGNVLAPAVVSQKTTELGRLQREAQFMQESHQVDEQNLEQRLLQEFQEKAFPVFEKLRAERNLWAIFTTDSALAALHPGLDLSPEAVKMLDAAQ